MRLAIEINLDEATMPSSVVDGINRSLAKHAIEENGGKYKPLRVSDEGLIEIDGNTVGRWDVLASRSPLVGVEEAS